MMDIVKLEVVHIQILKFTIVQLFCEKVPFYGNKEERSTLKKTLIFVVACSSHLLRK